MKEKITPTIKLNNSDCIQFLSTLRDRSVDFILIDPPYGVSRDTNFASGAAKGKDTDRFRVSMDFGEWDRGLVPMDSVISECYRVLKNGGGLICFYDLWKISYLRKWFENAGFVQLRYVEWLKTNPVPLNSRINYLTNAREVACFGVRKGKPCFNSEYDNGIYSFPICHDKGRFHPTQKPLALAEAIIRKHTNEGDLVLDCFLGSGSTALACWNLNRNFIGCEISKEYFDGSIKWLESLGVDVQNC